VKSPLEVLREANRRRKKISIETPLDFLRLLNRENIAKEQREKLLKRVR